MFASMMTSSKVCHQLRFHSPCVGIGEYLFPCDAAGHVDLDQLSERGRIDYFYARAMVGKIFCAPCVSTGL